MNELWNAAPNIGWFYVGVVGMALAILIAGMITFTIGHFRRRREPEDQF